MNNNFLQPQQDLDNSQEQAGQKRRGLLSNYVKQQTEERLATASQPTVALELVQSERLERLPLTGGSQLASAARPAPASQPVQAETSDQYAHIRDIRFVPQGQSASTIASVRSGENAERYAATRGGVQQSPSTDEQSSSMPEHLERLSSLSSQEQQNRQILSRPAQLLFRLSNKTYAVHKPVLSSQPRFSALNPRSQTMGIKPPTSPEPWKLSHVQKVSWLIRKRRTRFYAHRPTLRRVSMIIFSVLAALLVILLASGALSSYAYYESQLPHVRDLALMQINQSTRLYDRNGKLLYTLYNEKTGRGTPISYNEIPGVMQDAQIAAEDKTFWTNNGIDVSATLRSAIDDFSSRQVQTGASTLTQQVVKNLTNERQVSLQRKFTEAALAIGLTQHYPKWKILEMYLNISPYGAQEQGIEAASQDFFGLKPSCDANFKCTPAIAFLDRDLSKCQKPLDETTCAIDPLLGLARASLLAGIPQNPVIFDPITNPDNFSLLLQRQDYVLAQMQSSGMQINLGLGSQVQNAGPITLSVVRQVEAITKNIRFAGFQGGNSAPHFVRWVIQTLANSLGNGDYANGLEILDNSGLNIRTTLDLNLQTYVESAIHRHLNVPEYQKFQGVVVKLSQNNNVNDAAAVVMDAKTGEVLAMDGSANWTDRSKEVSGQINMALAPRQPGSSFKPIVMAAAFEKGWYPGIVLPDVKTYFPQGNAVDTPITEDTYSPTDYGATYHNLNSNIALSIANSFNVPAVKASFFAGLKNVYTMATRLGITTIDPQTGLVPSMALGTDAVPLLQMVGAYQTFDNQGVRIPPQNILDIWDNYGHHLYHHDPNHPDGISVLSRQVSFLVTSLIDNEELRGLEFGEDHDLSMWDWTLPDGTHPDVAAKTGTTDSFVDNWTIGYTPNLVVGVWAGNADSNPMVNTIGVTGAAPIWHSIIEYASGKCNTDIDQIPCPPLDLHYTNRHFTVPEGVIQQPVNTYNGLIGGGYPSYMLRGEEPQQSGLSVPPVPDPIISPSGGGQPLIP